MSERATSLPNAMTANVGEVIQCAQEKYPEYIPRITPDRDTQKVYKLEISPKRLPREGGPNAIEWKQVAEGTLQELHNFLTRLE